MIMNILNHIKTLDRNDKPDYNNLIDSCNKLLSTESSKSFDWYADGISWDKDGKLINEKYQ